MPERASLPAWLIESIGDHAWDLFAEHRWEAFTDDELRLVCEALVKLSVKPGGPGQGTTRESQTLDRLGVGVSDLMDRRGLR